MLRVTPDPRIGRHYSVVAGYARISYSYYTIQKRRSCAIWVFFGLIGIRTFVRERKSLIPLPTYYTTNAPQPSQIPTAQQTPHTTNLASAVPSVLFGHSHSTSHAWLPYSHCGGGQRLVVGFVARVGIRGSWEVIVALYGQLFVLKKLYG